MGGKEAATLLENTPCKGSSVLEVVGRLGRLDLKLLTETPEEFNTVHEVLLCPP